MSRDPIPPGELPPSERGEDPGRQERDLATTPARPLTNEEKEAARRDPGRRPRTYAPASARVPKPPMPGDEKFVKSGKRTDDE